jgi:hypothetical protein
VWSADKGVGVVIKQAATLVPVLKKFTIISKDKASP